MQPLTGHKLVNYISLAAVLVAAIVIHLLGASVMGGGTQLGHALLSLLILLSMLAGGSAIATIFRQHAASLGEALAIMRWLLIGFTVLSILGIRPLPGQWDKPIFPFTEPSHLALVLGPFLVHACVSARGTARILWIVGGVALVLFSKSLTLGVSMLIATLICLPLTGVVVAAFATLALSQFADLAYFTDRLNFDSDTRNLSSLIYRQGWELMGDALERTSGWGVGFQQLGYAPFRSPSADVLYSILRDDANTRDGGFLLAKIVSEFGAVGIILVLCYLLIVSRAMWFLRRYAKGKRTGVDEHVVLAMCVVTAFMVDMFVRDAGYFTTSVLLTASSFYTLWEARKSLRRAPIDQPLPVRLPL